MAQGTSPITARQGAVSVAVSVLAFFAWLALACLVAVALFGKEDGSGNTAYAILECALPGIGVMFWVLYLTTTHYERKNWRRTWEERNSG